MKVGDLVKYRNWSRYQSLYQSRGVGIVLETVDGYIAGVWFPSRDKTSFGVKVWPSFWELEVINEK